MTITKKIEKYAGPLIVVMIVILIIISIFIMAVPTQDPQMSIYSEDWNGLSKFKNELAASGYKISHVRSTPLYLCEIEDPRDTLFIIAGLEREYSGAEVGAISDYITNGGNVILADDFGFGNSMVKNLRLYYDSSFGPELYDEDEIGYEFSSEPVVDIRYDRDPNYPYVRTKTVLQFELLLNAPSGLVPCEQYRGHRSYFYDNQEILAQSSSLSWLDTNGNFSRDVGEPEGPFPIIMKFSQNISGEMPLFGSSESALMLISDPSIFINEMWGQADNREFVLFLVADILGTGGEVIFDESVHLNENDALELTNAYYIVVIYFYSNPLSILMINFLLFLAIIILMMKKTPKLRYYRHEDTLDIKKLYLMYRPKLDFMDYHWIKWILFEKVRISYNLPYVIFNSFTPEQMQMLLDDHELYDYVYHYAKMDKVNISRIVRKIIDWQPTAWNLEFVSEGQKD